MFRRVLLGVLSVAAAGTMTLALAGPASADDAHQTCTGALLCAGNVADVHDVTTTVTNVLNGLHLLGQ
jgi:hypothetical protein